MMMGVVNSRCEAIIPVVIGNNRGQRQVIDAVIDTGFNGSLTLPPSIVSALGLAWDASDVVALGDGSEALFDLYVATIIWDGQIQDIDVAESETDPLVGMGLLYGFKIQIEAIEGGSVMITALPKRAKAT